MNEVVHHEIEPKLKILFLCTGNSCRSQMAEGFARALKGDIIRPYSAGINPKGLDSLAVRVMAEIGINISRQKSKSILEVTSIPFDAVVTLCDHAKENCPNYPAKCQKIHRSFEDPALWTEQRMTEDEALVRYRRVRDEIKDFVLTLPDVLKD
ncbi:MAG: arsenate reductase ArsC [Candidatus Aureabacteria bacterium]|nr:arsenate reductase ArsC [Candidatus Auribacterota bacterium]